VIPYVWAFDTPESGLLVGDVVAAGMELDAPVVAVVLAGGGVETALKGPKSPIRLPQD
jgi:hypothetical protein